MTESRDVGTTALPWRIVAHEDNLAFDICTDSSVGSLTLFTVGMDDAWVEAEANARLIVESVNNHNALVEALRAARPYVDSSPFENALTVSAQIDRLLARIDQGRTA